MVEKRDSAEREGLEWSGLTKALTQGQPPSADYDIAAEKKGFELYSDDFWDVYS